MGTLSKHTQSRAFTSTRPTLVSYSRRFVTRFSHQAILSRHLKYVATTPLILKPVMLTGRCHQLAIPILKTTRVNGKMIIQALMMQTITTPTPPILDLTQLAPSLHPSYSSPH